jgi:uncharacterized damage-inducible protein DinB
MVDKTPWFQKSFRTDLPNGLLPLVIERLRGTPGRLEERMQGVAPAVLTARPGDSWSIQENIGHLLQVEELMVGRIDDYEAGKEVLRPADFTPGKVEGAGFNARDVQGILGEFRQRRAGFVRRVEGLEEGVLSRSALHPRLKLQMRMVDHLAFAAEHDDHHLARITEILRSAGGRG